MSTHKAIVSRIKISAHPNPEVHSLAVGLVCNETVICGINIPDGTLGIYFPCELQLSQEFAEANDLVRRKDAQGKPAGGMFDINRRVRLQTFKGVRSNGFWISLDSLSKLGGDISTLKEGDMIDEWNRKPICNKYFSRRNPPKSSNKGALRKSERYTYLFPEHKDTEQFKHHLKNFNEGDEIIISLKVHGCVHEDTLVTTLEDGIIKIKDLFDNKTKKHILCRDLTNEVDIFSEIDNYYLLKNHGEWYEIELENGQKLKITGNNPVWLSDEKIYKRVDELSVGENIQFLDEQ